MVIWRQYESSDEEVEKLSKNLNIDKLLAKILVNRKIDADTAKILLEDNYKSIKDPFLLVNAEKAARIIKGYCDNKNAEIWVFADYDVDGIFSGYIPVDALRKIAKCKVNVYYPERSEDYGISYNFVDKLIEYSSDGAKDLLVITVDNGIGKKGEIQKLIDNGIEVIVTDHHMPADNVPDCLIVDPFYNDNGYYKYLAGCGVIFKVIQLVLWLYDRSEDMINYAFAVAIGTIGDIMPISLENIAFVNYGLKQINSEDCPLGIKAFKDYIGKDKLTPVDIAWELVPRINACGRMGDVNLAAKMFFTDELQYDSEIEDVINSIEKINNERKKITKKAKEKINEMDFDNDYICIVDASEYPFGIAGILAGNIADSLNKPAIVYSSKGDLKRASARCPKGYDLQSLLSKQKELKNIVSFGGHHCSAGLKIDSKMIPKLKSSLNIHIEKMLQEIENKPEENIILNIDSEIKIKDITKKNYEIVNNLIYDNNDFKHPLFILKDIIMTKSPSYSKNNPSNINLHLSDSTGRIDAWAWGMADRYQQIGKPNKIDIVCSIENDFRDKKKYTIKIIDFNKSQGE